MVLLLTFANEVLPRRRWDSNWGSGIRVGPVSDIFHLFWQHLAAIGNGGKDGKGMLAGVLHTFALNGFGEFH